MSSIFGSISVETPKYTVLKQLSGAGGQYDVRRYEPQIRAVVQFESPPSSAIMDNLNSPFRMLAGFIFGGNTARSGAGNEKVAMTAPVVMQQAPEQATAAAAGPEKIAMTAPVVMQEGAAGAGAPAGTRTMSFIMPSQYTSVEQLPVPKDARVALVEVPARTLAAVHFRGAMTAGVAAAREAELRAACGREGVALSGAPGDVQHCAFNPPWCLTWFKTNEILIPVVE